MAITNNLTTIHSVDQATDAVTSCAFASSGGGSFLSAGGEYIEGSAAYGFDLDIETHTCTFTPTASLNLTASTLYVWLNLFTAGYLDTWQNGAVSCRLNDGSNWSEWYISGSDRASSGFRRYCFSTSSTPDTVSGTLSLSAVTTIVFYFTALVKSKLPENVTIDFLQYGADGTGLSVTGGSSGTPETFDDVVGDDATAAAGIFSESNGIYYLNGPVEFGDSGGTGATYFKDTNQILASIGHYRTFTTANRTSAESLVASTHNAIDVVGNSTGTTSFVMGEKTGSLGYSGCTVKTGGNRLITLTCTDTDVDYFKLYASTFIDCGAISFPTASSTDREVLSCSFSGCAQIDPSTCVFENCIIADTTNALGGVLLDSSGATGMDSLTFISGGSGHGLQVTTTGTHALNGFVWSGYGSTGTADAAVRNTSGGATTLSITNGTSPTKYDTGGSSTTISADVQVTLTGLVNPTEVRVYLQGTTTVVDGEENVTTGSWSFTETASTDVDIRIFAVAYEPADILDYTVPTSNTSIPVQQRFDRTYQNL